MRRSTVGKQAGNNLATLNLATWKESLKTTEPKLEGRIKEVIPNLYSNLTAVWYIWSYKWCS